MISAHSVFELRSDAAGDDGSHPRTVYRDRLGRTLIEWHGAGRPDDRHCCPSSAPGAGVLFRGHLADVGGAWYEGSEDRVSLYLLSTTRDGIEPDREGECELDVLSDCGGWACAQRTYLTATHSGAPPPMPRSAMLVLHWMPEHLGEHPGAARRVDLDKVASRLHERGMRIERRLNDFRRVKDATPVFSAPILLRRSQVQ